jgi:hypothetical protein
MPKAGYRWDEEKKTYALTKENSVEVAIKNIENLQLKNLVILNDDDYDTLYDSRTEINKVAKEIASLRKQMVMAVTGQFQIECKTIEKACKNATDEMTERLYAYKPRTREKTVFKLTIKVDNPSALSKIEKYALKYGAEVEISK